MGLEFMPAALFAATEEAATQPINGWYAFLADVVVFIHGAYVGFVVVGELLIVLGWICRWRWVRNPLFRVIHLLAIAYVAAEAIVHVPCPITGWEQDLREMAGPSSEVETQLEGQRA